MRGRPRLGQSVLVRLLAASVLVAVCSITATAWLVAQSTSTSIRQELGSAVASDARTYQTVLSYAVEHRTWDGVSQVVHDLARQTGRRIVVTTENRQPLADSGGAVDSAGLPPTPSAVVDPLAVDVTLTPDAPADRIDARVVGPFLLSPAERARLASAAEVNARCDQRAITPVRFGPSGRPVVEIDEVALRLPAPAGPCADAAQALASATPTETAALRQLGDLVNGCLAHQNAAGVRLAFDRSWRPVLVPAEGTSAAHACLTAARREQLRPSVAPPALLFVTDPTGKTTTQSALSSVGAGRIALVAAAVLLLTVGVSGAVAMMLVRPLRALTAAARRMRRGEVAARVSVRSRGEIGELAEAFNDMAEHRERIEAQRKAMVSDISHELRNPLGTIRSWLEGARDGVVELGQTQLDALLDEAIVLQHLIDDLQDLALVDAGALRLNPVPVELGDVLGQVAAAHRHDAERAGVLLVTTVDGEVVVAADPVRLRQVLTNLVTNALRYTASGASVRLSAVRVDEHVQIEVSDTGVGIDEADLPHVFDRFWRADRSRTRETGGSGLGLAIVHGLVQAHGGTVGVHSVPGMGTTFTVRIPGWPTPVEPAR